MNTDKVSVSKFWIHTSRRLLIFYLLVGMLPTFGLVRWASVQHDALFQRVYFLKENFVRISVVITNILGNVM